MAEIRVLGPLAVLPMTIEPIIPRSRLQQLLLATLVMHVAKPLAADSLVEALWGDELPRHPLAALQSQIFRLRRQLEPAGVQLSTIGNAYVLSCEPEWIDAIRFERLANEARAQRVEAAVALETVQEALGLWRGRAYGEVADHDHVRTEAARLEELHLDALELQAELLSALGRPGEALGILSAVELERPFGERCIELRMRALARRGRHADALEVFSAFRHRLGEELGLEPSPALCTLEGDILRHELPGRPAVGLPGNSFVGRDADVGEVTHRLANSRLVTLSGPGGIGKTRLALHVVQQIGPQFLDGAYFCELSTITEGTAVLSALASALHVEERGGHSLTDRVVEFLRTKRALLVLDNCEHVASATRDVLDAILALTTNVVVLATSRQRLGVQGEQLFHLKALATPSGRDADAPSVRLFVDRAEATRTAFMLDETNLDAVCELCRRLEGLPLGIELAAARCIARSPTEILGELSERFDKLSDTQRGVERHRSLGAVVGWSYDLLSPNEQAVFRNLAVFASSFSAPAAAAVLGTGVDELTDSLTGLVDRSLVVAETAGISTRFSLLEPIRQYALARLEGEGELDAALARYASWVATWVEQADQALRGPDERHWIAAVDAEFANLRRAHTWCLDHDRDTAARIVGSLFWYAYWHAPSEVFGWADRTIEQTSSIASRSLIGAFATAALGAWRRGDFSRARALAHQSLAHSPAGAPGSARFAWEALRSTEMFAGDYDQAIACHDHVLALARAAGDLCHQAHERALGALALAYSGRLDQAFAELEMAHALLDQTPNPSVEAMCSFVAGEIRVEDDPAAALNFLQRAVDAARQIPNRFIAAVAGLSAVSCAARLGNAAQAIEGSVQLIEYFHRADVWGQQWMVIRILIETFTNIGQNEAAAHLYGALTASPSAPPVIGPEAARVSEAVGILRDRMGEDRFDEIQTQGACFDDEETVAFALATATRLARR